MCFSYTRVCYQYTPGVAPTAQQRCSFCVCACTAAAHGPATPVAVPTATPLAAASAIHLRAEAELGTRMAALSPAPGISGPPPCAEQVRDVRCNCRAPASQRARVLPPHAARADSDGDGQSNGFELGDPCCVWTSGLRCRLAALCERGGLLLAACRRPAAASCPPGQTPQFTTAISNPGSSSSQTSRACNVVCSNGNNPCNLPSPTTTPPAPGGTSSTPSPGGTSSPATTGTPPSQGSCDSLKSCHVCTSSPSCGWCVTTSVCKGGSEVGSGDSLCLRSTSAWIWGAHACPAAKSGAWRR